MTPRTYALLPGADGMDCLTHAALNELVYRANAVLDDVHEVTFITTPAGREPLPIRAQAANTLKAIDREQDRRAAAKAHTNEARRNAYEASLSEAERAARAQGIYDEYYANPTVGTKYTGD